MKKKLGTVVQYLFFLGLGVLFVWLTLRNIRPEHWTQIKRSLAEARHWLILPVAGLLLLSHYIRALRWKILMEPLGYKPSTFNTFAAVMIGYLVNSGVPRLGEVVKCTLLSRYEQVRADKLVGTIVLERLVDLVCLFIIIAAALIMEGDVVGAYTYGLFSTFFTEEGGKFSPLRTGLFLFAGLTAILVLRFLMRRFSHTTVVVKCRKVATGIWQGLNSIRQVKRKGAFFIQSILIWGLYLLSTTAGLYALQETDHLGIGGGLTTLAIGSVGMIMTPGGIGAYPLLVAKLMELYGLDFLTTGTALGWLLWTVQTLIIVVVGLIFFGLFSYYNKKRQAFAHRTQPSKQDIPAA